MESSVYKELLECANQQKVIQQKQLDLLTRLAIQSADTPEQLKPMKQLLKLAEADHSETPSTKKGPLKDDETACSALLRIAIADATDHAETWKTGLDVQLIFIGLFVAVVSAFQIFALQSLQAETGATIFGILSTLWSMSLVLAIIAAIITMSGRQWLSSSIRVPEGNSSHEKLIKHRDISESARKHLIPVLGLVQPILFGSILLFLGGVLYQLWHITHDSKSWWSYTGTITNTVLLTSTACVLFWTFIHATLHEESPFKTQFTGWIRHRAFTALRTQWKRLLRATHETHEMNGDIEAPVVLGDMEDASEQSRIGPVLNRTNADLEAAADAEPSGYAHKLMILTSDPKYLDDTAPKIIPYFQIAHKDKKIEARLRTRSLKAMLKTVKFNTTTRTKLTIAKLCTWFFDLENEPSTTSDIASSLMEDLESQLCHLYRESIEVEVKHRTHYLSAFVALKLWKTSTIDQGARGDLISSYGKNFETFLGAIVNNAEQLKDILCEVGPSFLHEFKILCEQGQPVQFAHMVELKNFVRFVLRSLDEADKQTFDYVQQGVYATVAKVIKGKTNEQNPTGSLKDALELTLEGLEYGSPHSFIVRCYFLGAIATQVDSKNAVHMAEFGQCLSSFLWAFLEWRIQWPEYRELWDHKEVVLGLLKGHEAVFLRNIKEFSDDGYWTPFASTLKILLHIHNELDPEAELGRFDFSLILRFSHYEEEFWSNNLAEAYLFFLSKSNCDWFLYPAAVHKFLEFGKDKLKDQEDGNSLKQRFIDVAKSLLVE
ncbi:hypothetical protein K438DRAFT_1996355 [Mycena galopus ATCC 62051]|nr:hypothetical protein K438DRAFT_1996355 [Mycena galopus ATCC 62051]